MSVPVLRVIVTERSVRGERRIGTESIAPGDTIHLDDDDTRDGAPSPIQLVYSVTGELEIIVWSQPGKPR